MRKLFLIIIFVILALTAIFFLINKRGQFTGPTLSTPIPAAAPAAPKTFKFDRNTDLELELEKVNPQVLGSDFESNYYE